MTITSSIDNNSNSESPLKLNDRLKNKGIIQKFVKNIKHNISKLN